MNEPAIRRPQVSFVLGSYNRRALLRATVASLRAEGRGLDHEIIVVDGGSTDGALRWLTRQKDVLTIVQHNRGSWRGRPLERRGWGAFMNLGFRAARGRFVCMVSDDCLLVPGSLAAALEHFAALEAAGRRVGALAFYWRDTFLHKRYWVGTTLGGKLFVNHGLFLRQALEDVGFADGERYVFYHADGDLCLRMWERGWEVADCPRAFVEHFPHAACAVRSSNLEVQRRDWAAFLERWGAPGERGGAVHLEHADPARTALRFPPLVLARYFAGRAWGRLRVAWGRRGGRPPEAAP
ncbi:glycosyltransferase [Desulfocurvus sp.]|jgi:GT2 family glycosyltransferase|uniref:glycosyltransferase family 2 protein n=1 Tax=Desulfocurvus sp. TaxID=2871698 RepID=UPI0025C4F77C|nr:glycosyltransferase [Desulfocurvus sp.]MCK9240978.1 glycosyltransferase [Desulfocurvus sp.]